MGPDPELRPCENSGSQQSLRCRERNSNAPSRKKGPRLESALSAPKTFRFPKKPRFDNRDREFGSLLLQRRIACEPGFHDQSAIAAGLVRSRNRNKAAP